MSASWTPNRIHSGSARKLGLNVHDLADKFRDYYLARPAEVHVAAAWARMFGKWLNRNAPDPKPPKTPEELAEAAEAADLADWKAGRGRWAPKPDEAA
jgi:hypothetical protein